MFSVLKTDERGAKDINVQQFEGSQRVELYEQLKQCEHNWWQARQQLALLKERQMFWFGGNSFMIGLGYNFDNFINNRGFRY